MIFDALKLPAGSVVDADLCVVGCGAGGSMAATVAAEAGLKVIVLEAGEFTTPLQMSQREEEMIPRLLWDSGGRTTDDRAIRIHQGRGVGGSTLHNLNLCKRIPTSIFAQWTKDDPLAKLDRARYDELCDYVEAVLGVSEIPVTRWSRHNRLLKNACMKLGWRGAGLSHNRSGCFGSGFCQLGCSYDAKNNASRILVPRAVKAEADIITNCHALRVDHDGKRARGVEAVAVDPFKQHPGHAITVRAPVVCVAASATASAALLLRSDVPDRSRRTGRNLHIHPALVVAGDFEEPVNAFTGIPQSYECTEFLEGGRPEASRLWIVPAFAHPMGFASMLPGHGVAHAAVMARYRHIGAFAAMIHDRTAGTVRPKGARGLKIEYWPGPEDRRELAFGAWASAKLLFAAGAERVFVPRKKLEVIERGQNFDWLRDMEIERGTVPLTAVHPMSSIPMSDDPKRGPVDSSGAHHQVDGLYVADGSLFPTSIGVPPQISIYAMGLHVGSAIARR